MTSSISEIEKLAELFNISGKEEGNEDEDKGDSQDTNIEGSSKNTNNNKEDAVKNQQGPYAKLDPPRRKNVLDPEVDDVDELYFEDTSSDVGQKGWKKTPKWDISYRQSVTASDVFLGMGFKNNSTSSCENMVVSIDLPGENRQNIDLKIEKQDLTLTSPKFFLELNLPHPVDPKRGDAQFDTEGEKLIVTLIMDRELDILNF